MTEKTFDPQEAIIRWRGLEALLNLELLTRDDWQRAREMGDPRWMLTSKYFQEQERKPRYGWFTNPGSDDDRWESCLVHHTI